MEFGTKANILLNMPNYATILLFYLLIFIIAYIAFINFISGMFFDGERTLFQAKLRQKGVLVQLYITEHLH